MRRMGLRYKPSTPRERSVNAARMDQIRDFVIEYDKLLREEEAGNIIIVYTDESYCDTNHAVTCSWHPEGTTGTRNKSSSRGRCIIMMHAITKFGPLTEINNETGCPVDDLKWRKNCDTPHS
mmetsp:Transcript_38960/g.71979  ORF Transcript_38960/g.71979 Transcript_38960/m.71979 type:complete len:122 (+) Transcript_38960:90-455(+)